MWDDRKSRAGRRHAAFGAGGQSDKHNQEGGSSCEVARSDYDYGKATLRRGLKLRRACSGNQGWFAENRYLAPWLEYKPKESPTTLGKWGDERRFL